VEKRGYGAGGGGSEAYWHRMKLVLEGIAVFPGRRKRFDEPKDPVNMLLNYGYSFLGATMWLAVEQVTTLGKLSLVDARALTLFILEPAADPFNYPGSEILFSSTRFQSQSSPLVGGY
jgi:hypothetical protein